MTETASWFEIVMVLILLYGITQSMVAIAGSWGDWRYVVKTRQNGIRLRVARATWRRDLVRMVCLLVFTVIAAMSLFTPPPDREISRIREWVAGLGIVLIILLLVIQTHLDLRARNSLIDALEEQNCEGNEC